MIIKVYFDTREDGVDLYRTYSDKNYMIRDTDSGALYAEAVDVSDSTAVYEETDIEIEGRELSDKEALEILLGGGADEDE